MDAFENIDDPGNSCEHWTGKVCIAPGCIRPAGTAWGPYWCFEHNVERIKKIDEQLNKLIKKEQTPWKKKGS